MFYAEDARPWTRHLLFTQGVEHGFDIWKNVWNCLCLEAAYDTVWLRGPHLQLRKFAKCQNINNFIVQILLARYYVYAQANDILADHSDYETARQRVCSRFSPEHQIQSRLSIYCCQSLHISANCAALTVAVSSFQEPENIFLQDMTSIQPNLEPGSEIVDNVVSFVCFPPQKYSRHESTTFTSGYKNTFKFEQTYLEHN